MYEPALLAAFGYGATKGWTPAPGQLVDGEARRMNRLVCGRKPVQLQAVPNACAVALTRTCLRKTWLGACRQLYTQQSFLRTVFWLLGHGDTDGTPRGLLLEQGAAFRFGSVG
ncbi:hypothetical protein AB0425_25770 [Actinosynnema sp. NPDC051121]